MHRHRIWRPAFGACAAALLLAACSRTVADQPTGPEGTLNAARAEFRLTSEREGGIGTLYFRESVDGATGRYVATTHRICSVPQCQAAIDSASGTLDASVVAALIAEVESANIWSLRDDYGRTPNSADMMVHTLTAQLTGRDKSVRGDDGTFPDAARRVESALHAAITKARGR
jgi:hypothetical protein